MFSRPVPSRRERIARSIGYLLLFCSAFYVIFGGDLPKSLGEAVDTWQEYVWIGFMITALPCAVVTLFGLFRWEYALIMFQVGGILIYVVSMTAAVLTGSNTGSGIAMFIIAGLGAFLIGRWFSLSQLMRPLVPPSGESGEDNDE